MNEPSAQIVDDGGTILRQMLAKATELVNSGDAANYQLAENMLSQYVDALRYAGKLERPNLCTRFYRRFLAPKPLKAIRHSMDEQEFRELVAGKKVTLKIDARILPNAPTVTVALQDIGYDRIWDVAMDVMEGAMKRK
jgi:hypothetical protein